MLTILYDGFGEIVTLNKVLLMALWRLMAKADKTSDYGFRNFDGTPSRLFHLLVSVFSSAR